MNACHTAFGSAKENKTQGAHRRAGGARAEPPGGGVVSVLQQPLYASKPVEVERLERTPNEIERTSGEADAGERNIVLLSCLAGYALHASRHAGGHASASPSKSLQPFAGENACSMW